VAADAGGLVLTEIKTTIPAAGAPPPKSFQFPTQISVVGVAVGASGLGPFTTAKLVSGQNFTTYDAPTAVAVVDSAYAASPGLRAGSTVGSSSRRSTWFPPSTLKRTSKPPWSPSVCATPNGAGEPTGNLDTDTRNEIIRLLERLWQGQGLTLVLVTHDRSIARKAQRVAVLDRGRRSIQPCPR
jgi:hypothetical protein